MMKQVLSLMALFMALSFVPVTFAGNHAPSKATADAYFDIATGHKYIRNQNITYTEYSKQGKILRTGVPNTLPLLVSGKYIREIKTDHYLLYTKRLSNDKVQKILPALTGHPNGWKCEQIVSLRPGVDPSEPEAYEPID